MKMKSHVTLAAVIAAGLLASGCSQMAAQQVTPPPPPPPPPPPVEPEVKVVEKVVTKTVVDCSKCKRPAPRPPVQRPRPRPPQGGAHTHPPVPGCTDSIRHTHPFTNRNHRHRYVCTKGVRPAPRPPMRPRPPVRPRPVPPPMVQVRPQPRPQFGHVHPAIPNCTDSIRHNHRFTNPNHTHRYGCTQGRRPPARPPVQRPPVVRPPAPPVMPPIKPKGTFRGPIQIDSGVMGQYQQ